MRRHLRASAAVVAAFAAIGIVGPASASAEVAHLFSKEFSVPDTPISMAVDEATGSVYILTTHTTAASAGKIYKFDSAGNPSNFSSLGSNILVSGCTIGCRTIAVDNSSGINQGVMYEGTSITGTGTGPTTTRGVRVFLPNGRPSTTIQEFNGKNGPSFAAAFCGVAVDPGGVLFATHPSTSTEKITTTYKPSQIFPDPDPAQVWPLIAEVTTPGSSNGCRTAIDSASRMYVASNSSGNTLQAGDVLRYTVNPFAAGTPSSALIDTNSTGHAVDKTTNELYSDHTTSIVRFVQSGEARETFGTGKLVESGPIAVNSSLGKVYAANRGAKTVQVFSSVTTPDVTAATASGSQTTADLSASLGTAGAGDIIDCDFEYGLTSAYGSSVPCAEALPYSGAKNVTVHLTSLEKEKAFHSRVVVKNANGTTLGPDRTFTTRNVAGVSTGAPTDVTQSTATLNGSFVGNGEPTTYYFEWGPTGSYGNSTAVPPGGSAGEPIGPTPVSASISGLSTYLPTSSPYHVRLVAVNASGTTLGPDRTFFAAPPDPPAVSAVAADSPSPTTAKISGLVNPKGAQTIYLVEYGLTSAYGSATLQSESLGQDNVDHEASSELSGLTPGTTYHYRLAASNFGGVTNSQDQIFSTPASPIVTDLSAGAITETSATLGADIQPGFRTTTYYFEYGAMRLSQAIST